MGHALVILDVMAGQAYPVMANSSETLRAIVAGTRAGACLRPGRANPGLCVDPSHSY